MDRSPSGGSRGRRTRAVPGAIVLLAVVLLTGVWLWPHLMRQYRVLISFASGGAAGLSLVLWVLFASGWRPAVRRGILVLLVGLGIAGASLVRIRGVTGDFVPLFAWRWEEPAGALEGPPERPVDGADAAGGRRTPGSAGRAAAGGASSRWAPPGIGDFPRFLGPLGRAECPAVHLARDWDERPPRLLWRRSVGPGWSSFAVAGDQAVLLQQDGDAERCVAYDLRTGDVLWSNGYEARYESVVAGTGPRTTPWITADRIVTCGATGILRCLDRRTGRPLWSRDVVAGNGAELPEWGKSSSPLVHRGLVIASAGGPGGRSLVAYRLETGEPAWAGGDFRSGYASPRRATLAGREQILVFDRAVVASHDPADGRVLWSVPWEATHPNVAQPLPVGNDRVLVSSGYGAGCALFEVHAAEGGGLLARELWHTRSLKAKFANFVQHGEFVYGLDDGILVCLDLADGSRRWKAGRHGHGQMLLAGGDLLLVQSERGEVTLVEPSPGAYRPLGRFTAAEGRAWAGPALVAGGLLLVRTEREAACWELPLAAETGEG